MSEPFFSVILPMHNSAGFVRKMLGSIRRQSFKNYELICICDKCTDDTAKIAMGYSDKPLYYYNYMHEGSTQWKLTGGCMITLLKHST